MTTIQPAIEVIGVTKTFGEHTVLNGVDLRVAPGSVYCLLGPNGAGKTTTVQILTTLAGYDSGDVRVAGHDVRRAPDDVRANIGVTGQYSAVDDILTGEENLRMMADLHHLGRRRGRSRTAELLARFDLTAAARRRAGDYSGGMRRRLDLAMSLMGEPRIVFLDEPTTGLDPRSRRDMWQLVRELVDGGVTIFLTTQYLDEAEQLADRIGVLDGGTLVAEGTAAELKALVPEGHIELRFADLTELTAAAALLDTPSDTAALTVRVPSDGSLPALRRLLARLDDAELGVEDLSVHTPDLDDVFFALTHQPSDRKEAVR